MCATDIVATKLGIKPYDCNKIGFKYSTWRGRYDIRGPWTAFYVVFYLLSTQFVICVKHFGLELPVSEKNPELVCSSLFVFLFILHLFAPL